MKIRYFLLLLLIAPAFAGKVTPAQMKSGIIFKFAENINWPEEAKGVYFSIGFYGKDKRTFAALNSNALEWPIDGQKVAVRRIRQLDDLDGLNLLYVDSVMSNQAEKLLRATQSKGILLISEACKDDRFIMLNILYNPKKKKYTYRFNRNNIMSAGLKIKLDLLLHGGTEVDLKEWFQSMQDSLESQKKQVLTQNGFRKKLQIKDENLKRQLKENQARIDIQKKQLDKQAKQLKNQKQKLDMLLLKAEKKQNRKIHKTKTSSKLAAEVESPKKKAPIQQKAADRPAGSLNQLNQKAKHDQKLLKTEKSQLPQEPLQNKWQLQPIEMQQIILGLSIGLLVVVLLLVWTLYRAYRAKKEVSDKLEHLVQEKMAELTESNARRNKGIQQNFQVHAKGAKWGKILK